MAFLSNPDLNGAFLGWVFHAQVGGGCASRFKSPHLPLTHGLLALSAQKRPEKLEGLEVGPRILGDRQLIRGEDLFQMLWRLLLRVLLDGPVVGPKRLAVAHEGSGCRPTLEPHRELVRP